MGHISTIMNYREMEDDSWVREKVRSMMMMMMTTTTTKKTKWMKEAKWEGYSCENM